MEIFKIVGVGFVTAISAILLKQTKPELAFAVTIAGVIIVLMLSATLLEQTIGALDSVSKLTGVERKKFTVRIIRWKIRRRIRWIAGLSARYCRLA